MYYFLDIRENSLDFNIAFFNELEITFLNPDFCK